MCSYSGLNQANIADTIKSVKLLIDYGANVNLDDALYEAARNGSVDLVCLLLDHGADPNLKTRSDESFLEALQLHSLPSYNREFELSLKRELKKRNIVIKDDEQDESLMIRERD